VIKAEKSHPSFYADLLLNTRFLLLSMLEIVVQLNIFVKTMIVFSRIL